MIKRGNIYLLLFATLSCTLLSTAQSFEEFAKQEAARFNNFKAKEEAEFNAFRDKMNAEYAAFMRKNWEQMNGTPAEVVPPSPKPPQPIVADNKAVTNDKLNFKVVRSVKPQVERKEATPLIKIEENQVKSVEVKEYRKTEIATKVDVKTDETIVKFDYYGTPCSINVDKSILFTLKSVKENDVADCWELMSQDKFTPMISKLLAIRNDLELSDWGYYRLLVNMTTELFGSKKVCEARLLQIFILTQSGYDVRMARTDSQLFTLLAIDSDVTKSIYLKLDNKRYYVMDCLENGKFYTYNRSFPNEQPLALVAKSGDPKLSVKESAPRQFSSQRYKSLSVNFTSNQNLIDYYSDMPSSKDFGHYPNASLSKKAKKTLYPIIKQNIKGRSDEEAANIIINFVQTAFEYKTDEDQFGEERYLYGDETLFYPYSDCEDRAILFSVLIKELLGLDVVLIYYPGHLATAVKFKQQVAGDYLAISGKRYTICDPTYTGANIGQAMPQFKNTTAEVYAIQ